MLCEEEEDCYYYPSLEDYVCGHCSENSSYHDGNNLRVGRTNKLPSFSFEFEIGDEEAFQDFTCTEPVEMDDYTDNTFGMYNHDERPVRYNRDTFYSEALILKKYNFSKHHDSTVFAEYKSPIYRDHLEMQTVIPVLNRLAHLVGKESGSHIHVHLRHKTLLQRHYSQILSPVLAYMACNPRETVDVWGRFFNHFCSMRYEQDSRYNVFNVDTSYQTLEFRLCKFRNGKQYRNLIRLVRKIAYTIDWYFDNTPRMTDARCKELSAKLIGLVKKHATKI